MKQAALLSILAVEGADIKGFSDVNGSLAVVESGRPIPFAIKRAFYVYGVHPGDVRGQHAHRQAGQFLICLRGVCRVTCDDGESKKTIVLDSPTRGLYIPPSIWAEQQYAVAATILLVFSDQGFDENDYIRDYADFLTYRRTT